MAHKPGHWSRRGKVPTNLRSAGGMRVPPTSRQQRPISAERAGKCMRSTIAELHGSPNSQVRQTIRRLALTCMLLSKIELPPVNRYAQCMPISPVN